MTAINSYRIALPRLNGSRAAAYLLTVFVFLAIGCAPSDDVESDVAADSEIQLIERSEEGSYRSRTIVMQASDQKAVITQSLDDAHTTAELPFDAYEQVWRRAQALEVASMKDAPLENAFPGQSEFEFLFRAGETEVGFSAYAVDYLTDTRYRELARLILDVADKHLGDDDGGEIIIK